jgi:rare lipoprotein A
VSRAHAADNEEYEMRTYILSALGALSLGLLTLGPASAENAPWTCMSPAFACGGAPVAKSYRTQEFAGERKSRRQESSKRNRVAKHADGVKRAERADKPVEKKQAKVELPERKQAEAPAKPEAQAKGATEPAKDKTMAKVETEKAYRTTSTQTGQASYYGYGAGSQTASGARFNPNAMTAAHRTLPFGTKVRVTNKRNGKTVIVTINDRGPFIRGRIIDLSTAAAGVIGMRSSGVAPVLVERIVTN